MTTEPGNKVSSPPRSLKRWLVGGAAVLTLLVAGLVLLNLYRGRNPLTAERLAAARSQWEAAGVRDYDIEVRVSGRTGGLYVVKVREYKPVAATMNGVAGENIHWAEHWTVAGLFDVMEDELRRAADPSAPKCHTEIEFDPQLGYPRRFVRSSQGQNTIVEVKLTVQPASVHAGRAFFFSAGLSLDSLGTMQLSILGTAARA